MAKKDKVPKDKKNKKEDSEEKIGSKILSGIIVILIVVVWLAIFGILIKLDVGNFGSNILRPVLKDVPIINKILPDAPEEEKVAESDYEEEYSTLSQALDKIAELEAKNADYEAQIKNLNTQITDQTAEISRLQVFETNQTDFQATKDAFYNEVVYGDSAPDADTYIKWYTEIDPTNAEAIYAQILGDKATDEKVVELSKTYAAMKPAEAAAILETMTEDLDTAAAILNAMSATQRGAILGQMSPTFASNITKKLMP